MEDGAMNALTPQSGTASIPEYGLVNLLYIDPTKQYTGKMYRLSKETVRQIAEMAGFTAGFEHGEIRTALMDLFKHDGTILFELDSGAKPNEVIVRYMRDRWSAVESSVVTAEPTLRTTYVAHSFPENVLLSIAEQLRLPANRVSDFVIRINFKERSCGLLAEEQFGDLFPIGSYLSFELGEGASAATFTNRVDNLIGANGGAAAFETLDPARSHYATDDIAIANFGGQSSPVTRPDYQNVIRAEDQGVTRPDYQRATRSDDQGSNRPDYQSLTRSEDQGVTRPDYQSATSRDDQGVTRLDYQSVTRPDYQSVTRPDYQSVIRPDSQSDTAPDSQSGTGSDYVIPSSSSSPALAAAGQFVSSRQTDFGRMAQVLQDQPCDVVSAGSDSLVANSIGDLNKSATSPFAQARGGTLVAIGSGAYRISHVSSAGLAVAQTPVSVLPAQALPDGVAVPSQARSEVDVSMRKSGPRSAGTHRVSIGGTDLVAGLENAGFDTQMLALRDLFERQKEQLVKTGETLVSQIDYSRQKIEVIGARAQGVTQAEFDSFKRELITELEQCKMQLVRSAEPRAINNLRSTMDRDKPNLYNPPSSSGAGVQTTLLMLVIAILVGVLGVLLWVLFPQTSAIQDIKKQVDAMSARNGLPALDTSPGADTTRLPAAPPVTSTESPAPDAPATK
jgi:hypothetical protein